MGWFSRLFGRRDKRKMLEVGNASLDEEPSSPHSFLRELAGLTAKQDAPRVAALVRRNPALAQVVLDKLAVDCREASGKAATTARTLHKLLGSAMESSQRQDGAPAEQMAPADFFSGFSEALLEKDIAGAISLVRQNLQTAQLALERMKENARHPGKTGELARQLLPYLEATIKDATG